VSQAEKVQKRDGEMIEDKEYEPPDWFWDDDIDSEEYEEEEYDEQG